jgi:hypothetical protein
MVPFKAFLPASVFHAIGARRKTIICTSVGLTHVRRAKETVLKISESHSPSMAHFEFSEWEGFDVSLSLRYGASRYSLA